MKVVAFSGDHYELGLEIGNRSAIIFKDYIKPSKGFQYLTKWKSSEWLGSVKTLIQHRCPEIYLELQGIADGSKQDFDDILLWNCRGDLVHCIPEGCTSIGISQHKMSLVAHNEDGDPALREYVFILEAELKASTNFTSFIYPASLPGHSFAMNEHGLAFTVNNIRLTELQVGLPRMVVAKSLLESRDCSELIAQLNRHKRSGGFHYTVSDTKSRKAYSIEAPFHGVSQIEAKTIRVHANHLIHEAFDSTSQLVTDSSNSRQNRMEYLAAQKKNVQLTVLDCLEILRDRHHEELPIYRMAKDDPDEENTLATVIFSFTDSRVHMTVYSIDPSQPSYEYSYSII